MRFAQKPLPQPAYSFVHVPKASISLENSSLQRIENREHFQTCMAEMLLLGKEAARRRKHCKQVDTVVTDSASKPLSLEYCADRLDVDEPCFGYLVRTKTNPALFAESSASEKKAADPISLETANATNAMLSTSTQPHHPRPESHWKEGMLQGFITLTTFTSWQKTFRWDSLHPEAYGYDPPALISQRKKGIRKWDLTGQLAKELQQTVHMGDVWNEGVVWPRIAEISLLGALGCGRTLVKVALEHLENLKATADQNYDYVVLQATDNSISFYESLGFVRVGGIMEKKHSEDPMSETATSEITTYVTTKRGEVTQDISKKFEVDVWDVIFLNRETIKGISPSSRLLLNTTLKIPLTANKKRLFPTLAPAQNVLPPNKEVQGKPIDDISKRHPISASSIQKDSAGIEWYNAKENDTPTKIAKMCKVKCQDFIQANAERLPGLTPKSRLKSGTLVQVSHLHIVTKCFTAYAHWSFPKKGAERGEPSYLMCYKLQKQSKKDSSLVSQVLLKVEQYTPTPLLWGPLGPPKTVDKTLGKRTGSLERKWLGPPKAVVGENAPRTPVSIAKNTGDALVKVKVCSDGECPKPSPFQMPLPINSSNRLGLKNPKCSVGSFVLFCQDMRKRKQELLQGLSIAEASCVLSDRWKKAPQKTKERFEKLASDAKKECEVEREGSLVREQCCDSFACQSHTTADQETMAMSDSDKGQDNEALYNRIVKIKPEAHLFTVRAMPAAKEVCKDILDDPTACPVIQPNEYEYWFVLTFIPDLEWCHLVPLVGVSTFSTEDRKPRFIGKTKWKLVDEKVAQEIEISSRYVVPVKAEETKCSANADNEEWVILAEGDEEESLQSNGSKRARKRSRTRSPPKSSHTKKHHVLFH